MAAKNSVKKYLENGHYHLYNRGVAKNQIFTDDQDYGVFMHYLKDYLSPPKRPTPEEIAVMKSPYLLKNYHEEIKLIAFCLMPNHFHLLLKQSKERSIEKFMQSLGLRYTSYFNKRHKRVGHLYQGIYKAILVENDEYLWWLTRYIHRNPTEILKNSQKLFDYPYSSYPTYLGQRTTQWLNTENVLAQIKNYQDFVEGVNENPPENYPDLILEQN